MTLFSNMDRNRLNDSQNANVQAFVSRAILLICVCITIVGIAVADEQVSRQSVPFDGMAVIWGGGEVPPAVRRRFAAAKWIDLTAISHPDEPLPGLLVSPAFAERPVAAAAIAALEMNPGLVGVWVPRETALVVAGRQLEVIGRGRASICVPPSTTRPHERPLLVEHLAARDRADLLALRRAAIARRGPLFPSQEPHVPEVRSGTLLACGGGDTPDSIWRRFIELAGGVDAPIVLIPIATPNPDVPRPKGLDALQRHGCRQVQVLRQRSRAEIDSPDFAEALQHARGVWFVGGRQWKYVDAYEGTVAEQLFRDVLRRGGVIAGTSAGAAIQAEYLVRGDPLGNKNIIAEGYERGLNLLPGTAIDIHVSERGRLNEMRELIREFPQLLGISLDERTAIEVHGHTLRVLGDGRARITSAGSETSMALVAGDRYDLANRRRDSATVPPATSH